MKDFIKKYWILIAIYIVALVFFNAFTVAFTVMFIIFYTLYKVGSFLGFGNCCNDDDDDDRMQLPTKINVNIHIENKTSETPNE